MNVPSPTFILLTAACNEEDHLARTAEAVAAQTRRPLRWVIVNDGSSDGTGRVAAQWAAQHDWIRVVERPASRERSFGSKVRALDAGFATVRDLPSDFIGILDADITFGPDYYEQVLARFAADPQLGVAGGQYHNKVGETFRKAIVHPTHVPGAIQFFRRALFEKLGGYQPIHTAGEDTVAEVRARMLGWKTRSFAELVVWHHRRAGTGGGMHFLRSQYRLGMMDYNLGYHPLFMAAKTVARLRESPYVLAAACRACGYLKDFARRAPRDVSGDFIEFLRREQMQRLLPGKAPASKGRSALHG